MDCERARNADLSMSMNRQPADPYRTDQVCLPVWPTTVSIRLHCHSTILKWTLCLLCCT